MNREIKFRVWHADYNKMEMPEKELAEDIDYWDRVKGSVLGIINTYLGYKDDKIFMQYTELKDKNGKEIYEGDVLDCDVYVNHKSNKTKSVICKVVFSGGMFYPKPIDGYDFGVNLERCTVIGNMYENGELLTKYTKDDK